MLALMWEADKDIFKHTLCYASHCNGTLKTNVLLRYCNCYYYSVLDFFACIKNTNKL